MKFRSGTVRQGSLSHKLTHYRHERISYPVVGVVLNVYTADDPLNKLVTGTDSKAGSACQAKVLVVKGETDAPWILHNVLIAPPGSSGFDDFAEDTPTPTTGTIDGSLYSDGFENIPPWKLNGDWCVVHFIGGSIHQPIMLNWFPHPANRVDSRTSKTSKGNLSQGRRLARRMQGSRFVVTSKGSVLVDTSEANHPLKADGHTRTENTSGGDVRFTVKRGREFEVNFNPSVFDPSEPDFLWAGDRTPRTRSEESTRLLADENFIKAVAGRVAEVYGKEKTVLGVEAQATENFVLGQQLKSLLVDILNALLTHNHPTGVGPSGPPQLGLTELQNALTSVLADEQLSSWIFGQKDPPT